MAESIKAEQKKPDASNGERGTQYPADNLETAVANLGKVRTAVGFGAANREIIAAALGYRVISGHASRRLGSLSHYDLIERAGKGAARVSALGKSILVPTTEEERRLALAEAAKRPNLYAALIARFSGHALPTMLPNLLVREHGVHAGVADDAAATFRETVEFAGLLRNGVLHASVDESPSQSDRSTGAEDHADRQVDAPNSARGSASSFPGHTAAPAAAPPQAVVPGGTAVSTILLDQTGRTATIALPVPFTKRDLRKLGAWLTYMTSVLDDEDEEAPDTSGN